MKITLKENGTFKHYWPTNAPVNAIEVDTNTAKNLGDNPDSKAYINGVVVDYKRQFSADDIAAKAKADADHKRISDIDSISVMALQGKKFNGNEAEQARLVAAIVALEPEESIDWVLADETVTSLTREELKEVLKLAVIQASGIRNSGR